MDDNGPFVDDFPVRTSIDMWYSTLVIMVFIGKSFPFLAELFRSANYSNLPRMEKWNSWCMWFVVELFFLEGLIELVINGIHGILMVFGVLHARHRLTGPTAHPRPDAEPPGYQRKVGLDKLSRVVWWIHSFQWFYGWMRYLQQPKRQCDQQQVNGDQLLNT